MLEVQYHVCDELVNKYPPIHRCFTTKRCDLLVKAFVTYVSPILQFNSPVWSPSTITVTYVNRLESVQRSFAKRLPGFYKYSYQTRLKMLGLERLEIRRIHALQNYPSAGEYSLWLVFKAARYSSTNGHSLKLELVLIVHSKLVFFNILVVCSHFLFVCVHRFLFFVFYLFACLVLVFYYFFIYFCTGCE